MHDCWHHVRSLASRVVVDTGRDYWHRIVLGTMCFAGAGVIAAIACTDY